MTKVEKIIADIDRHVMVCGGRIVSSDDPVRANIAWACLKCQKEWTMPIKEFKLVGHWPEWVYEYADEGIDHEGDVLARRAALESGLNRAGSLRVWREQKEYDVHDCAADVMTAFLQSIATLGGYHVPIDEREEC